MAALLLHKKLCVEGISDLPEKKACRACLLWYACFISFLFFCFVNPHMRLFGEWKGGREKR